MAGRTNSRMVDVPISYEVEHRIPRSKAIERTRLRAVVPVSIDEIEAPVALEVDSIQGIDVPMSFRWDGENFWRPMLDIKQDRTLPLSLFAKRAAIARFDKWPTYSKNGIQWHWQWHEWPFRRADGTRDHAFDQDDRLPENVLSSDLEDRHMAAQAVASDMRVIDGIVHLRSPEPVLSMSMELGIFIGPALWHTPAQDIWRNQPIVRIDRFDLLRESIDRQAAGIQYPMKTGIEPNSFRVLLPAAFVHDDLAAAAERLFGPVLANTQYAVSRMASLDTIVEWMELRRLADLYHAGQGEAFHEAILCLKRLQQCDLSSTAVVPLPEPAFPMGAPDNNKGLVEHVFAGKWMDEFLVVNEAIVQQVLGRENSSELSEFKL